MSIHQNFKMFLRCLFRATSEPFLINHFSLWDNINLFSLYYKMGICLNLWTIDQYISHENDAYIEEFLNYLRVQKYKNKLCILIFLFLQFAKNFVSRILLLVIAKSNLNYLQFMMMNEKNLVILIAKKIRNFMKLRTNLVLLNFWMDYLVKMADCLNLFVNAGNYFMQNDYFT